MAVLKGKQPSKGAKQIKEENQQTYDHYTKIVLAGYLVYGVIHIVQKGLSTPHWLEVALLCFSLCVSFLCMKTFSSMLNHGLDLNMDSGMAEHVKDILLITVVCQVLGGVWLYLWTIWLVVPAVAFYQLWVKVLSPWIFAEAPPEMSDKQKRKFERKQRR